MLSSRARTWRTALFPMVVLRLDLLLLLYDRKCRSNMNRATQLNTGQPSLCHSMGIAAVRHGKVPLSNSEQKINAAPVPFTLGNGILEHRAPRSRRVSADDAVAAVSCEAAQGAQGQSRAYPRADRTDGRLGLVDQRRALDQGGEPDANNPGLWSIAICSTTSMPRCSRPCGTAVRLFAKAYHRLGTRIEGGDPHLPERLRPPRRNESPPHRH
jgi:hypothetical protein